MPERVTQSRARPLLGTLVAIRAEHAQESVLGAALESAFAAVAQVHRLMSAQAADSDLGRINAAPTGSWLALHPATAEVLRFALELAELSGGVFDPTVGGSLARAGLLPRPAVAPDAAASWRDLELDGCRLRAAKPVQLDFGGIAKGYAVDRALAVLRAAGCASATVNAGGDLARYGGAPEAVHLRLPGGGLAPLLQLGEGAAASSCYEPGPSPLVEPGAGPVADCPYAVCVTAPACMTADALTKLVALRGEAAAPWLAAYGAAALLLVVDGGSLRVRRLPGED